MSKIFQLLFITLFSTSISLYAQKVGEQAPDFTLTNFFQAPSDAPTTLSGLRGNIVVLEFWATWCAPCRVSMKRLDTIAKKFSGKPIRFLAISKESQGLIETFVKSHPNNLWIGVDGNKEANTRYGVDEIPHLVIIDKNGSILGITRSDEVTEERLQQVLEGRQVYFPPIVMFDEFIHKEQTTFQKLPTPKVIFKPFDARGGDKTLFNAFTPTITDSSFFAITILPLVVQEAYEIPLARIKPESEELMSEKYYAQIQIAEHNKKLVRETLKNLLNNYVDVQVDKNILKEKVVLLERTDSTQKIPLSKHGEPQLQYSESNFTAKKQPIKALTTFLQSRYRQQKVIDKTGLTGEYDLDLWWSDSGANGLKEALKKSGLLLRETEQAQDVYIVRPKK